MGLLINENRFCCGSFGMNGRASGRDVALATIHGTSNASAGNLAMQFVRTHHHCAKVVVYLWCLLKKSKRRVQHQMNLEREGTVKWGC